MKNFLTKTSLDVIEGITISQFFVDFVKQIIIAVAVVIVNTLMYPLLKYVLNRVYKKFNIKEDVIEDIDNIVDDSLNKLNDKINKLDDKNKED